MTEIVREAVNDYEWLEDVKEVGDEIITSRITGLAQELNGMDRGKEQCSISSRFFVERGNAMIMHVLNHPAQSFAAVARPQGDTIIGVIKRKAIVG